MNVRDSMALVGVLLSSGMLLVALFGLLVAAAPAFQNRRSLRLLNERESRGQYDRETIRSATKYYVRPACSNVDPSQEAEFRHAAGVTRSDLFKTIDGFADDSRTYRHLLILADSGTGKTSFLLNYFLHNRRRKRGQRSKLALISLSLPNAVSRIAQLSDPGETVLMLDALDEDTKAIDDHSARLSELMQACQSFRRVIITCRTQFFPRDEEIPVDTGIVRIGPRKANEATEFEFRKLYLSPFDDKNVKKYLRLRYPFWRFSKRSEAMRVAEQIPSLTARPMLLAYIPDLIERGSTIYSSRQLYDAMVEAWLARERKWVNKNDLREFSELLAVDLYANRGERGMERIAQSALKALAKNWGITLEEWQMRGRSLLNRDALGNLKFAHRSVMEYLFVQGLLAMNPECYKHVLSDQMVRFLVELLMPRLSPELTDSLCRLRITARCVSTGVIAKNRSEYPTGFALSSAPIAEELSSLRPRSLELSELLESVLQFRPGTKAPGCRLTRIIPDSELHGQRAEHIVRVDLNNGFSDHHIRVQKNTQAAAAILANLIDDARDGPLPHMLLPALEESLDLVGHDVAFLALHINAHESCYLRHPSRMSSRFELLIPEDLASAAIGYRPGESDRGHI